MTDDLPHDSAYVYSQIKGKHPQIVGEHLYAREQKKGLGQTVLIALILMGVLLAGWGTAYELQVNILNRPEQLIGICPPPAVITNNGCFVSQTYTDQQGNSHTQLIPAGSLLGSGP